VHPRCRPVIVLACLVFGPGGWAVASVRGETFHVSPQGDDAAAGSVAAPFRTLQRGAESAQPGDTVLVAPGVYRERVAPPRGGSDGKPIVFRSVERHKAVIKGSDVWRPTWRQHSNAIWSAPVDPALFTDTAHVDGANPFEIALVSTPWGREGRPEYERHLRKERAGNPKADKDLVYSLGQVFMDGIQLRQVPYRGEMEKQPDTWWYDRATRELFVHRSAGGPQGCVVEITTRRRIFAPHERGLGHIEIDGFVFEHCGNQYPTDFWIKEKPHCQQAGAVGTRSGHDWHIHHNVIRLANGVGLDLGLEGNPEADIETGGRRRPGSAGRHVVEDNWILDNGCAGTAGYMADRVVLARNVITGNNSLRFSGQKRWESGGLKLHRPNQSRIERNFIAANHGQWGIWLDQGPGKETQVIGNVVIGHGVGIDFEVGGPVSDKQALIADNVLIDNAVGISFRECGGTDVVHNLVLGATKAAIECTMNVKRTDTWTAENIGITNNILVVASGTAAVIDITPSDFTRSAGRRFDGNLYGAPPQEPRFAIRGRDRVAFADWQQFWQQANGGRDCDAGSRVADGIAYDYAPETRELVLRLPAEIALPQCPPDPRVATDLSGKPFPDAAKAPPGPFAGLKSGENRFTLWTESLPPSAGLPEGK
jgi:hypothetical protein